MSKSRIIERVRKILAKVGNGATEEEAQTAIAMAARILQEHNLAMSDIAQANRAWTEGLAEGGERMSRESKYVAPLIGEFFDVVPIGARTGDGYSSLSFFGELHNVEVATWVYGRLVDQFRDLLKRYRARTYAPADCRKSYYVGLHTGLYERLERERKRVKSEVMAAAESRGVGTELATIEAGELVLREFESRYPHLKPKSIDVTGFDQFHTRAGYLDSSKISYTRPLAGQADEPFKLD